jgi:hypothetical protein
LRLEITDGGNLTSADSKHTRIIVVDTAPALFSLMCGDPACRDGGHDVTNAVLDGLRAGATSFEVQDACYGGVGSAQCGRTMLVEIMGPPPEAARASTYDGMRHGPGSRIDHVTGQRNPDRFKRFAEEPDAQSARRQRTAPSCPPTT